MKHLSRRTSRALVFVTVLASTTLGWAGTANAHVTVSSTDAEQGGYGKLVFRVPNESDTAVTRKLEVSIPTDTPITSIGTKPVAGWDVTVTKSRLPSPVSVEGSTVTEAVSSVTWTTNGPGIGKDQFMEFEVSAGPLPQRAELTLPAVQTYSDGQVVRWDEPALGSAEPEHPAPSLELATEGEAKDANSNGANSLSIIALVVSGLALGSSLLVVAMKGRRRA